MSAILFIFGAVVIAQSTATRKCDNLGILVYDDMNCTPNFDGSNKCPSSYRCPDIKQSEDTCYFRGNSIKIGEHLNSSSTFCSIGCSCSRRDTGMTFSCAELDCAGYGPPPSEGCYLKYNLDSCCGGYICPPDDRPVHKCVYDGEEYLDGQRFFPKNSCSMCLCQKGFKGKVEEPFCIARQCDGQVRNQDKIQKSCAPVHSREDDIKNGILCCPNTYTCPDGNEVIEGKPTSSLECKYGDKTVKVGQSFKKQIKNIGITQNVVCKCSVPPLLTCIREK